MRRLLGTLGGIALTLALVASPVAAQEPPPTPDEPQGQWTGTTVGPEGSGVKGVLRWRANLTRTTVNRFEVQLRVTEATPSQEGCPVPDPLAPHTFDVPSTSLGDRRFEGTFARGLPVACNGRYTVQATALARWTWRLDESNQTVTGSDSWTSPQIEVTVANSAGTPRELSAERADGGRVRLAWTAPSQAKPPDFLGYAVDRIDEDGTVTRLASGTSTTGLTDTAADPDQALEYRVVTLREGPGGPGTTPIESEPATAGVEGPPEPEPSPTTTEAGSAEVADGRSQGGGGAPDVRRPRTGSSRPRIGSAPSVTPTTVDTGFDESLPFDPDRMVGPRDAVTPDDEFASLIFDEPEGAGLAVPAATAAVLAVWAMHLHHLNRLARQDP
jgi:hypothetical protein